MFFGNARVMLFNPSGEGDSTPIDTGYNVRVIDNYFGSGEEDVYEFHLDLTHEAGLYAGSFTAHEHGVYKDDDYTMPVVCLLEKFYNNELEEY